MQAEGTHAQNIGLQVTLADRRESERGRGILREHEGIIGVVTCLAFGTCIGLFYSCEVAHLLTLDPFDCCALILHLNYAGPD